MWRSSSAEKALLTRSAWAGKSCSTSERPSGVRSTAAARRSWASRRRRTSPRASSVSVTSVAFALDQPRRRRSVLSSSDPPAVVRTTSAEKPAALFCDLTGERVYLTPEFVVSPNVNYERKLERVTLFTNVGYSWRSNFYGSPDSSELAKLDSYGVLNAPFANQFTPQGSIIRPRTYGLRLDWHL